MMKVDIAIMTIREDEFMAVRGHFKTERQRIPDGRTYLIGEVKTEKQTYTIAIARCSEQGNDASQRLAHYMIQDLDPQLILVVGIAGGVPRDEFTLGDVVISTRIVNPNVDAWHTDGTTDYTIRGGPPHPVVEDIVGWLPGDCQLTGWTDFIQLERPRLDPKQVNISGDDEWREKVWESLHYHFGEAENRSRPPLYTIGTILSSNHLMKDPTRLKSILKTQRAVFAVEMEAAGVCEAAYGMSHYPVAAIRGISDIVGLQRDNRWTAYACQTAAAFAYAFIMAAPIEPRGDENTDSKKFESKRNPIKAPTEKIHLAVEGMYTSGGEEVGDSSFLTEIHQEIPLPFRRAGEPGQQYVYLPSDIADFTGREYQLKQLEHHLIDSERLRVTPIASITGTGGMGKSALAIHFAHRYRDRFPDGIIFLSVDSDPVDVLAKKFAFFAHSPIDSELQLSAAEIMQSVFRNRRALLIFDNVEDVAVLSLLPGGERCAVIITTRDRGHSTYLDAYEAAAIDLQRFTLEETKTLLNHQIGQERIDADHQAIETIHELVGGLPLAIRIIGSTLKLQKRMTLTEYLELLQKEIQESDSLSRLKVRRDKNRNVEASFSVSVNLLENEERALFACLGACIAEDFGFSTALAVSGQNATMVNDAMGRLLELSLINQGRADDRFVLHPLLSVFARKLARNEGILEGAEQRHTEYFVRYLQKRQNSSSLEVEESLREIDALLITAKRLKNDLGKAIEFYEWLDPILQSIGYWSQAIDILDALLKEGREQKRPYAIAYCLLQQGQFLRRMGLHNESERLLQEGGEIARQVEDAEKSIFLVAMMQHKLGGLYREQRRWVEAEINLRASLEIWISQKNAKREAMVLNTLGSLYVALGKFEDAEQVLTRGLEIQETEGNESGTVFVLNTLGKLYVALGRFEEAEQVLMRSLGISEARGDRGSMTIPLNMLAGMYRTQGRLEEAEQILVKALGSSRELLSKDKVVMLLKMLGTVHQAQERFEEAEEVLQEGLKLARDMGVKRQVIVVLKILGSVYRALEQFEKAEAVLQEGLKLARDLKIESEVAQILNSLSALYQSSGDTSKAINALNECLQFQKKREDLSETAAVLYKLGGLYSNQGYTKEAEAVLREGLEIGRALGMEIYLARGSYLLGRLYFNQNRIEEAEAILREGLAVRWKRLEDLNMAREETPAIDEGQGDHRGEVQILRLLKELYQKQNCLDKAVEILKQSLKIRKGAEPHISDATVLQMLGEIYLEQRQLREAEETINTSLSLCEQWKFERVKALALRTLGEICQAQGELEKAVEMLKKSLEVGRDLIDMRVHTITVLSLLEEIYQSLGRFEEAEKALEESLQLGYEQKDALQIANMYLRLGDKYQAMKAYEKAIKALNRSRELRNEMGDILGEAMILHKLAKILYSQGTSRVQADEYLSKSLKIYKDVKDVRGEIEVIRTKAGRYKARKMYTEAEKFYKESIELSKQLDDDKQELLLSWRSLQELYTRWKKRDLQENASLEEEKVLEECLEIYKQQKNTPQMAITLHTLGRKYRNRKLFDTARDTFKECLELQRQQGNRFEEAGILLDLGRTLYDMGEHQQAVCYLQESFRLYELQRNTKELYSTLYSLKRVFTDLNLQEDMREYCQRALRVAPNDHKICAICEQISA
jgi:tetratricopeptide (TPR) repeat protein/nucleoside phosphorylase